MYKNNNQLLKPEKVQKPRGRTLALRDALDKKVYEYLMGLERPPRARRFVWSRNRIAITLLRAGGLRVNEIRPLTWLELRNCLEQEHILTIYQTKTQTFRKVRIPEHCLAQLRELKSDLQLVFKDDDTWCLGNDSNGRLLRSDEWIKIINKYLKPAVHRFGLNLKSHSFRINYVTRLLEELPIQKVKTIVGHRSIQTTTQYDRFFVNDKEAIMLVDKALRE